MISRIIRIFILFIIFVISIIAIIYFNNPHSLIYIYVGDDEKTVWLETKYIPFRKIISDTDYYKFSETAQWSPDDRYFSYYDFVRLEIYKKEWALKIFNARTFSIKTIFIGDNKTSEYKWLDDKNIRVYEDAGTGVRIYRDININVAEPFIAADYMSPEYWTPEKTF